MTRTVRHLPDAFATQALAAEISLVARPGDVILLEGDLGAGKSTFARAFIQALAGAEIEVPSPTFTLLQLYDECRIGVAHADLYRLSGAAEADELGLVDLAQTHLLLIEWPDRLEGAVLSPETLRIELSHAGEARSLRFEPTGTWAQRIEKLVLVKGFLERNGWGDAQRRFLEGDASSRRYERLAGTKGRAILMDMPARDDRQLLKNGRTYSDTARLAHSAVETAAIARTLRSRGYSAPQIHAANLDLGFLITEDLGDAVFGRMMREGADMREPLAAAVEVLASLAREDFSGPLAAGDGKSHFLPDFDAEVYAIELDLFCEWFMPAAMGSNPTSDAVEDYRALWRELLQSVLAGPRSICLRDFHSPNLLWLPERHAIRRVGLIDTQDALLGHPAYDLASLLQDARVPMAPEIADQLLDQYCTLRKTIDPGFDARDFRRAFLILATQRLFKVLGIFVRLYRRDRKPQYLKLVPHLMEYLSRNLSDPQLAPLSRWWNCHLPEKIAIHG